MRSTLMCVVLLLSGGWLAAGLQNVVTVAINVQSGTDTCSDWYEGPSTEYVAALQAYAPGLTPAVACRQVASTVHQVELVSAEPGTNMLFDDPRKVAEAVVELRNMNVTNRVSLNLRFHYTVATPEESEALYVTLNDNIRNGNFLGQLATAAYPLLTAVAYEEVFSGGVAC